MHLNSQTYRRNIFEKWSYIMNGLVDNTNLSLFSNDGDGVPEHFFIYSHSTTCPYCKALFDFIFFIFLLQGGWLIFFRGCENPHENAYYRFLTYKSLHNQHRPRRNNWLDGCAICLCIGACDCKITVGVVADMNDFTIILGNRILKVRPCCATAHKDK